MCVTKNHKQIPSLLLIQRAFCKRSIIASANSVITRLWVQFGSQWSRTSSASPHRSHLTKACYSLVTHLETSPFLYFIGKVCFCSAVLLEQLYFLEKNYQNHATTIFIPVRQKLWCSWLDFSLGAGWEVWRWGQRGFFFFFLFFLGTAILFEPLTARLVDLDQ